VRALSSSGMGVSMLLAHRTSLGVAVKGVPIVDPDTSFLPLLFHGLSECEFYIYIVVISSYLFRQFLVNFSHFL